MLRAAVLAAAVAVLGAAVWMLLGTERTTTPRERAVARADKAGRTKTKSGRPKVGGRETPGLAALVNRPVPRAGTQSGVYEPPAVVEDPGRPRSQAEVVSRFESFIADLEAIQEHSPKMSREDKERVYVESSAMLSALTEQFDLSDPQQARYIEEARGLMLTHLNQMGIGPAQPQARPTRQRNPPPQ